MSRILIFLFLISLMACGRNQDKAFAFAESDEFITFSEDLPADAEETLALVVDLIHARGWRCKMKVEGACAKCMLCVTKRRVNKHVVFMEH